VFFCEVIMQDFLELAFVLRRVEFVQTRHFFLGLTLGISQKGTKSLAKINDKNKIEHSLLRMEQK